MTLFGYWSLALAPGVAMVTSLAGLRIGSFGYNTARTDVLPAALRGAGIDADVRLALLVALVRAGHSGADRAVGYGHKYTSGFPPLETAHAALDARRGRVTFKVVRLDRQDMSDAAGIYARESDVLDRYVQIGVAGERVLAVSFPETPDDEASSAHPLLDRIDGYLDGEADDFADVTVALTVPTDQRTVLETIREIPYGERVSVEQLTRMTAGLDPEDDGDRRLVRTALGGNPAPLLIPDHRVSDGPSSAPSSVVQRLRTVEGL